MPSRTRLLILAAGALLCALIACWPAIGGRTLRVELQLAREGDVATGRIYYAEGEALFSEERVAVFRLQPEGMHRYTVRVPVRDPARLRLRLDPLEEAGASCRVAGLRLRLPTGLRETLYEVLPSDWGPSRGLIVQWSTPRVARLTAEDDDPQIQLSLGGLRGESVFRPAVAGALLLFLGIVLVALDFPGLGDENSLARYLIYVLALGAFAVQGSYYLRHLPYGIPPDEKAHVSYLAHLEENGRRFPDPSRNFLYDERGRPTGQRNNLGHPPYYYDLLQPFAPSEPRLLIDTVDRIRLVNLFLALAGVGLFLWIGCREELPLPFHIYYCTALTAVPMLPYLAGSVNNDNLVLLGGGLAVYGARLFLDDPPRRAGLVLLGSGLALALLVKATAGLQIAFFFLLVCAWRLRQDRGLAAFRGPHTLAVLLLGLAPLAHYLATYARYGAFVVQRGDPRYVVPEEPLVYSFLSYLGHFARRLADSWTGVMAHEVVFKQGWLESLPLLVPLALALWGAFGRGGRTGETVPGRRLFLACRLALLALALMAVPHFLTVYRDHRRTGYLGGIQARYYFPLMPCLLLLSFRPFLGRLGHPLAALALALLLVGFVYSGFFYYILAGP